MLARPLDSDDMAGQAFLRAADSARTLLDHPDLAAHWDGPSSLEAMTTAELCGHLTRAVKLVSSYLDQPGTQPPVDAPGYFLSFQSPVPPDLGSDSATAIRSRGGEAAAGGLEVLRQTWDEARQSLSQRLALEDGRRLLAVLGSTMSVDDYLVTRTVELVIHADDLAAGLGAPTPEFDDEVLQVVVSCLWDIARRRSQPMDIIRAMARVERDTTSALRVF